LLPPLSEGDSKLGDALNLIKAVTVSEVTMLKRPASTPDEIVTVADSETLIVAALAEVAMFSAAENEEDEVKVGAVVSGDAINSIVTDP
jgi:effector-binding domain-containing protein